MEVYRQKPIPVIFTELPFIRRSGPCPFVDSLEDASRLQELKDVASGKQCVSLLEYRSEFIIKCILPDDILERTGNTNDELVWHSYKWKMWDVERIFEECEPAKAVALNEARIDVAYLQSIAEKSSCIPLLQKMEALFGNKGYTLRNDVKKKIHDLETRLHAGLDIDSMKGLRPATIPAKSKSAQTRLLPPKLRNEILCRDKYRCIFCGAGRDQSTTLEVHHIIPRSLIAKLNLDRKLELAKENLCTMCFPCNRGKSDNLAIEDVEFYLDAFSQESHLNHAIVTHLEAIRRIQSIVPVTTGTI